VDPVTELRDPVSSASHLVTAVWAVYATLIMCRLTARQPGRQLAVAIYGASMVLLYLASGTFHGLHYATPEEHRFFQRLDQSAIFLLIAGTCTPVLAVLLDGAWRVRFLQTVWVLALTGIACLWALPKAPHAVTVGVYMALGWVGFLSVPLYARAVGWRALTWVWVGTVFYTLGAVCELTEWPVIVPGFVQSHEVLHLCDTAGTLALFLFVVRYVIPFERGTLVPVCVETEAGEPQGPVPAPAALPAGP
jgi:hemolysin III